MSEIDKARIIREARLSFSVHIENDPEFHRTVPPEMRRTVKVAYLLGYLHGAS